MGNVSSKKVDAKSRRGKSPEVVDISVHSSHADASIVAGNKFRDESRQKGLQTANQQTAVCYEDGSNDDPIGGIGPSSNRDIETGVSQQDQAGRASFEPAPSGSDDAIGKGQAQAQGKKQSSFWKPFRSYFGGYAVSMPIRNFS